MFDVLWLKQVFHVLILTLPLGHFRQGVVRIYKDAKDREFRRRVHWSYFPVQIGMLLIDFAIGYYIYVGLAPKA